jgi:hypothetical protein
LQPGKGGEVLTIRKLKDMIAEPFGLAADPAYRAGLDIGLDTGVLDGSGKRQRYNLAGIALAEHVLVMCALGTGIAADARAFLVALRASGVVPVLANLIELSEAGDRTHLDEAIFTIDGEGRALFVSVVRSDRDCVEIDGKLFGGSPKLRTFTLDGFMLAEALAD